MLGLDALVSVANVIYLVSYSVREILWLRILTVIAATMLMPDIINALFSPGGEMGMIGWGFFSFAWAIMFIVIGIGFLLPNK